jgi:hypothetical protein
MRYTKHFLARKAFFGLPENPISALISKEKHLPPDAGGQARPRNCRTNKGHLTE